jgi:predicted nucleic acid-binding protein
VIGTLGVLILAKRLGALPSVAPMIERLRASGHYPGDTAVAAALRAAGED